MITGYSGILLNAPVILLIPKNNAPNPKITSEIFLVIGLLPNIIRQAPTKMIYGAMAVSFKETSCAVIVVPMLAPNVIPTDCSSVRSPAFTKLTSITVVAPDDWIIAVNIAPKITAMNRFFVTRSRMTRILSPAAFCSPSLMNFIPNKNSASPLSSSVSITNMILSSLLFST